MIYEKGVVGEGKFVLTGDLLVARNRLAFVAEEMGFYHQQSSAPKTSACPDS